MIVRPHEGTRMNGRLPSDQYVDSRKLSARANLHTLHSTNPQGWENWLFQQIVLDGGLTVMDLGCGPAWLWRNHCTSIPAGCLLTLTDASPGMVSEAKDALSDERFQFRVVNAQELPFPDEHFDCVTANHMLYHVSDLDMALSEIARVLTPRGKLCAATNGTAHMRQLYDLIRQTVPSFRCLSASFTLENGRAMLDRCFSEVSIRRYEDGLVVPDAEALSAYVRSMGSLADATDAQFDEIEEAIHEHIRREGAMRIEKDAGLFIARKPREAEPSASGDADNPRR